MENPDTLCIHVLLNCNNTQFYWNAKCQSAFKKLKQMISETLCVSLYDPNTPTFLSTDASEVGISAVLSQIQNGSESIIACASHTLASRAKLFDLGTGRSGLCLGY